jgi:hypothetical protein
MRFRQNGNWIVFWSTLTRTLFSGWKETLPTVETALFPVSRSLKIVTSYYESWFDHETVVSIYNTINVDEPWYELELVRIRLLISRAASSFDSFHWFHSKSRKDSEPIRIRCHPSPLVLFKNTFLTCHAHASFLTLGWVMVRVGHGNPIFFCAHPPLSNENNEIPPLS